MEFAWRAWRWCDVEVPALDPNGESDEEPEVLEMSGTKPAAQARCVKQEADLTMDEQDGSSSDEGGEEEKIQRHLKKRRVRRVAADEEDMDEEEVMFD